MTAPSHEELRRSYGYEEWHREHPEATVADAFEAGARMVKWEAYYLRQEAANVGFDNVTSFFDRLLSVFKWVTW